MSNKILYVVNIPRFFVSHRLPLAIRAKEAGYDVHVATSNADQKHVAEIQATGLPYHPLPLSQHGTSPLTELKTLQALVRLYRTLQPDIVHQVSIKPVLYGGIASKVSSVKAVISAISGLGYVFIGEGRKPQVLRQIVKPLMRVALSGENTHMIFQNPDDQARFIQMSMIQQKRTALILGSGVDMDVFSPQPETNEKPVVLFAGRLMWKKGIGAFVESARHLKDKARFVIVGYAEATSPDNVTPEQLQAWEAEGLIEYWGKRDDMPEVFAQSHIVCLPSTYGEGVPKVLIEAAACGRAIVTTDTPGCREIVRDGQNGILVAPNNQMELNQALDKLIENSKLRQKMGQNGRKFAQKHFSLDTVVQQTLALYEKALN